MIVEVMIDDYVCFIANIWYICTDWTIPAVLDEKCSKESK